MPPAETICGEKKQKFSWQKLHNLRHSFSKRKLAISLAIVASLSLSWAGGYSLAKVEKTKDKAVETIEKTDNSAIDIRACHQLKKRALFGLLTTYYVKKQRATQVPGETPGNAPSPP